MKTAVVRIIEGCARFPMWPAEEPPFRFIDPEDCQFAIELEDDEELKQIDVTAAPNSQKHKPIVGNNGEAINVMTSLYLFRAVAVSTVDKSAVEIMDEIEAVRKGQEQEEES